jgi:hypothetical protein
MATVGARLDDPSGHSPERASAPRAGSAGSPDAPTGAMFRILATNLPALHERIGRLARRAERLGTSPLVLRDTGRRDGEHALVVLEGEPPALAGWTLAAVVDHRGRAPAIRVVSSSAPALDPMRFRAARCDHCRLPRRRAETYVVWHAATRRLRQVGSGCLRDFLGGHDPERLCRQAEYLLLTRESLRAAAGPRSSVPAAVDGVALDAFAAHAAMVLRADGWVSRERARATGRPASADAALRSLRRDPAAPRASDVAVARGALGWARELLSAKPDLSDFERDATVIACAGRLLTARERGLACALIGVYRRRRARSEHVGQPGAWLHAVVLVERIAERPSRRHTRLRRHDLIDIDGNRLVWWQTSGTPLPSGRAVRIRARIERHTRFGRTRVTVLARCRPLP